MSSEPRLGWVSFHMEGLSALKAVLESGVRMEGVITFESQKRRSLSGAVDYMPLCREYGLELHEVTSLNDAEAIRLLEAWGSDVVFVIGWTEIIKPHVLEIPNLGMVGAHASLLPEDRGRAPVNWTLIRGKERGGNTLMWLSSEVDGGDIIDQREITVTRYDTCATLYQKVAATNRDMIMDLLPRLERGERPGRAQPEGDGNLLPGRKPKDGLIDWSRTADEIYNLIRGVTRPYPGAFSVVDGEHWKIWDAACCPLPDLSGNDPGTVLGAVYSPSEAACGQLVACRRGGLVLLEVEMPNGTILKGPALSDAEWTGRILSHE